jgi:type I restriction enzyme S subunit
VRLRHVAQLNPPVSGLASRAAGLEVSFLPLERIWADDRYDPSETVEFSGDIGSYNPVAEGDVLLPKVAPTFSQGRVAIARGLKNGRALATSEVFVVRTPAADARFLAYRLRASDFLREGEAAWTGVAGLKRVSSEFVRDVTIDEGAWRNRTRITGFLDRECERIAALSSRLSDYQTRIAREWLSSFERETYEESKRKRLKRFGVDLVLGPFGSLLSADEYETGGVPVINPIHIDWRGLRPQREVTVSEGRAASLARYRLMEGDVVLARRGELGRAAVVAESERGFLCGTGSARLRCPSENLDPAFVVLMLMTEAGRAHLSLTAVGSTMPNLNGPALLDLDLPDWTAECQRAAVGRAGKSFASWNALGTEIDGLRKILAEYRDALITEAVTGKFDVAGLSEQQLDESAHAALEGKRPEVLA